MTDGVEARVGGFEKIEPGIYTVQITNSKKEYVKNQENIPENQKKWMLQLELTVIDRGQYENRMIIDNLNLQSFGPKAETTMRIAKERLAAYSHVCGAPNAQKSEELHNFPFKVEIGFGRPGPEGQEPRSEVKQLFYMDGTKVTNGRFAPRGNAQTAPAPRERLDEHRGQSAPQAQSGGGSAPWRR
jgi:hypothetical protein